MSIKASCQLKTIRFLGSLNNGSIIHLNADMSESTIPVQLFIEQGTKTILHFFVDPVTSPCKMNYTYEPM